ncbi:hypothetical protein CCUG63695_03021 [Mycobacteroides franklinii]|uniref:Uncharacterized protein n=1 Tax=Mycobacteroides franklinii TaxID=948102 RepID=A0A4R8R9Q9_9MYCO|nr:hypothetical protein CCUG64054_03094 [Mycobacteroides franklinii]TDZ50177.1 hypothetical protein CCUG63697_01679 [Mycobacteroides franklinii]TDZ56598.1 hypothetical protein CCUG63696_03096 [Mycobacteroides franklinii]TDZ63539.1 hypothetical protein CCUG63695_03021 [Mycobacteroides franklinii]TDZ69936.1 hypothetical protein CCUG64056_03094 [Mycobacteroides franklinii]
MAWANKVAAQLTGYLGTTFVSWVADNQGLFRGIRICPQIRPQNFTVSTDSPGEIVCPAMGGLLAGVGTWW